MLREETPWMCGKNPGKVNGRKRRRQQPFWTVRLPLDCLIPVWMRQAQSRQVTEEEEN